jgi:hypothetical protein
VRGLSPSVLHDSDLESNSRQSPAGLMLRINGIEALMKHISDFQKQGATILGITSHRSSLEEILFAETTPAPSPEIPHEVRG